jgi:hypothetical protein
MCVCANKIHSNLSNAHTHTHTQKYDKHEIMWIM